jgi:diguanylate cyclase (GGDEF)-like protein
MIVPVDCPNVGLFRGGETDPRRRAWRVPLTLMFGVVSLILTLLLGAVLAFQINKTNTRRSVQTVEIATNNAVQFTVQMMAVLGIQHDPSIPMTHAEMRHASGLFKAGADALGSSGTVVASEGVLPDSTVMVGKGATPTGGKIVPDAKFRQALNGRNVTEVLRANHAKGRSSVEQRLLREHGDLLLVQTGERMAANGPVLAVVRAYAPLADSHRQAMADTRKTLIVLGIGLLVFWVAVFRLVVRASRALARQAATNKHLATHDTLTGLPNRALLRDRVEQAIRHSHRTGRHVALMLTDLDRFKEINDTLGHQYGDLLLRQIGPRLQGVLRDGDTIARLGGDEFVVMLPDLKSAEDALRLGEKLAKALQEPFSLEGVVVDVGSSIGVAITPENGEDFDQLLQRADIAMYVAKQDNLGVVTYAPELDEHSPTRLALLGELRRAVETDGELVLHYQPKADLASGQITGVEALVRWQHPVHGMIPPSDFIPLAERTGTIRDLTWRVLRMALQQNASWMAEGIELPVAVNISARCLLDPELPSRVAELLAQAGVPARLLELELTESTVMADPDLALSILQALDAQGIRLAIDDFGTGYSSMAYLKKLPVHELKIDRTFVTRMDQDVSDAAIVRSSLELARNLSLEVVAEGVETPEVWERLTDLGCDVAQGYYLQRPIPAEELTKWLALRSAIVPVGADG